VFATGRSISMCEQLLGPRFMNRATLRKVFTRERSTRLGCWHEAESAWPRMTLGLNALEGETGANR
jgi:hypothetical protein